MAWTYITLDTSVGIKIQKTIAEDRILDFIVRWAKAGSMKEHWGKRRARIAVLKARQEKRALILGYETDRGGMVHQLIPCDCDLDMEEQTGKRPLDL